MGYQKDQNYQKGFSLKNYTYRVFYGFKDYNYKILYTILTLLKIYFLDDTFFKISFQFYFRKKFHLKT